MTLKQDSKRDAAMSLPSDTTLLKPATKTTPPVEVDHVDRHGYLFGKNLTNSYSPFVHGIIYGDLGLRWEQFRLDSADIPYFLELVRHSKCYGTLY